MKIYEEILAKVKMFYFTKWRNDIQHNDTQHNGTQHIGIVYDTQHNWTLSISML